MGGFKVITSEDVPPSELWVCNAGRKELVRTPSGLAVVQHLTPVAKLTGIRPY